MYTTGAPNSLPAPRRPLDGPGPAAGSREQVMKELEHQLHESRRSLLEQVQIVEMDRSQLSAKERQLTLLANELCSREQLLKEAEHRSRLSESRVRQLEDDFTNRIAALQAKESEFEAMERELNARAEHHARADEAIKQREEYVSSQARMVAQKESQLRDVMEREGKVRIREMELQKADQRLEEREAQQRALGHELDTRLAEVDRIRKDMAQREAQLAERESTSREREAELAAWQEQLRLRDERIFEDVQKLSLEQTHQQTELVALERRVQAKEEEVRGRLEEVQRKESQLAAEKDRFEWEIASRESSVAKQEQRMQLVERGLAEREEAWNRRGADLEMREKEREKKIEELTTMQKELIGKEHEMRLSQRDLHGLQEDLMRQKNELGHRHMEEEFQIQKKLHQLLEKEASLNRQAEELKCYSDIQEWRRALQEKEHQLASRESTLGDHRSSLATLEAQLQRSEREGSERRVALDDEARELAKRRAELEEQEYSIRAAELKLDVVQSREEQLRGFERELRLREEQITMMQRQAAEDIEYDRCAVSQRIKEAEAREEAVNEREALLCDHERAVLAQSAALESREGETEEKFREMYNQMMEEHEVEISNLRSDIEQLLTERRKREGTIQRLTEELGEKEYALTAQRQEAGAELAQARARERDWGAKEQAMSVKEQACAVREAAIIEREKLLNERETQAQSGVQDLYKETFAHLQRMGAEEQRQLRSDVDNIKAQLAVREHEVTAREMRCNEREHAQEVLVSELRGRVRELEGKLDTVRTEHLKSTRSGQSTLLGDETPTSVCSAKSPDSVVASLRRLDIKDAKPASVRSKTRSIPSEKSYRSQRSKADDSPQDAHRMANRTYELLCDTVQSISQTPTRYVSEQDKQTIMTCCAKLQKLVDTHAPASGRQAKELRGAIEDIISQTAEMGTGLAEEDEHEVLLNTNRLYRLFDTIFA